MGKVNIHTLMEWLMELGYKPAPEVRIFGGPFALRRPDGSTLWERDFEAELEKVLK